MFVAIFSHCVDESRKGFIGEVTVHVVTLAPIQLADMFVVISVTLLQFVSFILVLQQFILELTNPFMKLREFVFVR